MLADPDVMYFAVIMGFLGGLVSIPMIMLAVLLTRNEETRYLKRLDEITRVRELLLQHLLEMNTQDK